MNISETDFELLSALIDDELCTEQKELMYQRLKSEEELQQVFIGLQQLKKSVSANFQCTQKPAPRIYTKPLSHFSTLYQNTETIFHSLNKPMAVSLTLLAVLFMYSLPKEENVHSDKYNITQNTLSPYDQQILKQRANSLALLHQNLSKQDLAIEAYTSLKAVKIKQDSYGITPDLSLSNLYLVFEKMDSNDTKIMHYRGLNGCKLTLKIENHLSGIGGINNEVSLKQQRFWDIHNKSYQIIASGMDQPRFDDIAAYVKQLSINSVPVRSLLVAMEQSYHTASPCT